MAFLTLVGEPGTRVEEVARLAAQRMGFVLVTESRVREMIAQEFGSETVIPEKAWAAVLTSLLAQMGMEHPLVVAVPDAEMVLGEMPQSLRVKLVAPEGMRVGMLMLEHRMERGAARELLRQLERQGKEMRKARFGRVGVGASSYDFVINTQQFDSEHVAGLLEEACRVRGMLEERLLGAAAEAQIQFQMRLRLAKFGITPPGKVSLKTKPFANASEEIFANLLDFYRIPWEYEPRSFAVQWDKDGRVLEAFTPDFYLPEFDLYVELTTMKQAHVTKKNRKVKLLRTIYPHINIQVFYQRDFKNLIFKHGLSERTVMA